MKKACEIISLAAFLLIACKQSVDPKPPPPASIPSTPTDVRIEVVGSDSVLRWTESSGALTYSVHFSVDDSGYVPTVEGISSLQYILPIYGYYKVAATNSAGTSPLSVSVHHLASLPDVVETPSFNIEPGAYDEAQDVAITTSTPDSTIYYTLDGTTPSIGASPQYIDPIPLSIGQTATITAIAAKDGYSNSNAVSGLFHIKGWTVVGTAGFSAAAVFDVSLTIDASGAPCVAYMDGSTAPAYKATVRRFNGSSWPALGGTGVSSDIATGTSIAASSDGSIYLTYADYSSSLNGKATSMTYSGGSWSSLGDLGFSAGTFLYSSLAVHSSGSVYTPYVAYKDGGNGDKATVKSFDGSTWITVGTDGFSDGQALGTSIAVAVDGTPYIAYKDGSKSNKATVKTFSDAAWSTVPLAGEGLSADAVDYLALSVAPSVSSNILYIAYKDTYYGGKAMVKKYDSGAWDTLPPAGEGLSSGVANYVSLAIAPDGVPFIAYSDGASGGKATVKKYDSGSWRAIGGDGFTIGAAEYISLRIDATGTPYLAFKDMASGGMATVMSFK